MHNCAARTTTSTLHLSDPDLVRRARRGDAAAFDELCTRHRSAALAAARSAAPFGGEAEDAVQDALLIVARRIASLREDTNFASYLCVVARRLAVRRAARNRVPLVDGPLDDDRIGDDAAHGCPELAVLRREDTAAVATAMRGLPDRQRTALVRTAVAGDSYAEIGADLGLQANAVAQLVHRARVNVREALAAADGLAVAA